MATLSVDSMNIRVAFSTKEKVFGVVRDYEVPVSSVTGARLVGSWRDDVRGLRVGVGLPGVRLLGNWFGRGHRQLVSLRRGKQAVYISLRNEKYDELLIESDDADGIVSRLTR